MRAPFWSMLVRAMLGRAARRPEEYAMLVAQPDAPAREMYGRWGWAKIATVQGHPGATVDDVLVRKL